MSSTGPGACQLWFEVCCHSLQYLERAIHVRHQYWHSCLPSEVVDAGEVVPVKVSTRINDSPENDF